MLARYTVPKISRTVQHFRLAIAKRIMKTLHISEKNNLSHISEFLFLSRLNLYMLV